MYSAAWASFGILLSLLGALYGWFAWQRQGTRGLVRGAALTILPISLWLTGTLRLVGAILDWATSWATGLVLNAGVILGTVLFVLSVLLLGVSSRMSGRARPAGGQGAAPAPRQVRATKRAERAEPAVGDDDLADIEALLRRRGIQ